MKISAIICAYNEEETIKNVVTTVSDYFFDEVIVINDGSTDKTDEIVRGLTDLHNLKYISLPENKGKGYAMATGVKNAIGEIITFIDADLSNLTEEHFSQLLTPLISKEADMVLGQPTETVINYSVNPFKALTGQRTVWKSDILSILEDISSSRFGVETLINLCYKANGKRVKYISLNGLKHPTKFQKTSVTNATKQFVAEGHEIAITLFKNYDLIINSIMNKLIKEEQKMKTKEIKKQIVADLNKANEVVKESLNDLADKAHEAKSKLQIRTRNIPVIAKKRMQASKKDVKDFSGQAVEIGKSTLSRMQKGIKKGSKIELDKKQ
ncbi:MAG: glycosyltransferase family 2 protein [Bacteroidales bacterium]|nr:glycosyltransferase family 2 protein [Bacteroidales bacterium]